MCLLRNKSPKSTAVAAIRVVTKDERLLSRTVFSISRRTFQLNYSHAYDSLLSNSSAPKIHLIVAHFDLKIIGHSESFEYLFDSVPTT
jgi:hypothetical protein